MELTNCVECKAPVSDSASQCPKCNSASFRGFTCNFCGGHGKHRDFVHFLAKSPVSGDYRHLHEKCREIILNEFRRTGIDCPACGKRYPPPPEGNPLDAPMPLPEHCDTCAHPFKGEAFQPKTCMWCGLPAVALAWGKAWIHHNHDEVYWTEHKCCWEQRSPDATRKRRDQKLLQCAGIGCAIPILLFVLYTILTIVANSTRR